jgi:hypothetical protein
VPSLPRSRTLSVSIERPPDEVYAFASDPRNLPRWASGLGLSISPSGDDWTVETPQGPVKLRFAERNAFGILDHTVTLPTGQEVHVPMRVVPNGAGSEVLCTLFQPADMPDVLFNEDAATVEADLRTLKGVLEA